MKNPIFQLIANSAQAIFNNSYDLEAAQQAMAYNNASGNRKFIDYNQFHKMTLWQACQKACEFYISLHLPWLIQSIYDELSTNWNEVQSITNTQYILHKRSIGESITGACVGDTIMFLSSNPENRRLPKGVLTNHPYVIVSIDSKGQTRFYKSSTKTCLSGCDGGAKGGQIGEYVIIQRKSLNG